MRATEKHVRWVSRKAVATERVAGFDPSIYDSGVTEEDERVDRISPSHVLKRRLAHRRSFTLPEHMRQITGSIR